MRLLQVLVLALATLWGGYWFIGSRALERAASGWFQAQGGNGLVAGMESLSVAGFPSRFDLTVNEISLADPATGLAWTAPFVQVLSLSYKPWHVIVAFAPEQQLATPFEVLTLASGKLQASVVATPRTALPLDRTRLIGDDLRLASSLGWSIGVKTLRLASRRLSAEGDRHEIGVEALEIAPDAIFLAGIPSLPATIEQARLDADLTFSAPLDRFAGDARPGLTGIDVKSLSLIWGPLSVGGSGQLAADSNGFAEGRITLNLKNWRQMVPVGVALGWFTPEVAPTWENMLDMLARQSGDPENLDLPLTFRNGRMSVGPLPMGPAPRLR